MKHELTFEFLGYEDYNGNKYPPDHPPEWMVDKIRNAFIKIFEKEKEC